MSRSGSCVCAPARVLEAAQIDCRPDGVLVRTKPQEVLAQRVVLALGPWLSRALPEIATVLEVIRDFYQQNDRISF
jgi:hypothetical protein